MQHAEGRRTAGGAAVPDAGRLRADARRNQAQILQAAREVVAERGATAPLDEIARRAGVGIGTLYRRFPDRQALLHAVVLDALAQTRAAAERALEQYSGFDALAHYMHAVVDLRVSAVIPQVLDLLDLHDAELGPARDASAAAAERLVDAAHADGSLPEQVGFGDVGTFLVRLSRPLPGPVPTELDLQLAHRHLDVFLAGLRAAGADAVPGPALSRDDLARLQERHPGADGG
ncbi:MAG TPA: TetR family transcriptional regulator [Nocardioidaceae bacterium]|jgi:AcrR family transcriptional regulator